MTSQSHPSPVGPKVEIPRSPSDAFELIFTPAFLDTIVERSNLYAKEVMGEDKYILGEDHKRRVESVPWFLCADGNQQSSSH